MKASVTILSYNRYEYLKNTFESLFNSLTCRDEVEIIIVDNGSVDNSKDYILELYNKKLINKAVLFDKNQGISKGYNSGFALSNKNSEYLIKLDCDIIIHNKGWLEEMDAIFKTYSDIGLLMLFQDNHSHMQYCDTIEINGRKFISLDEIICGSACFTIPKNTFKKLGYFNEDENFAIFYDDIDYYIRVNKINKKSYYLLSHISSHQNHLDNKTYFNYNKEKEIDYEIMDNYLPILIRDYESNNVELKKNYDRIRELRKKEKGDGIYIFNTLDTNS
jgi:GT2 family glycosyltransferase